MTSTYLPAWDYAKAGWPWDTELSWIPGSQGDMLRLWLPQRTIGIQTTSENLERVAWLEARLGELPRTWTLQNNAVKPAATTRIYRTVIRKWLMLPTSSNPTVTAGIAVPPTAGVTADIPCPPYQQLAELPETWIEELAAGLVVPPKNRYATVAGRPIPRFHNRPDR